jgi:hypothetical protein
MICLQIILPLNLINFINNIENLNNNFKRNSPDKEFSKFMNLVINKRKLYSRSFHELKIPPPLNYFPFLF